MQNLGWDVQIDSFTEPNTVLGRAVNFQNVIATLDKNVSIYGLIINIVKSEYRVSNLKNRKHFLYIVYLVGSSSSFDCLSL